MNPNYSINQRSILRSSKINTPNLEKFLEIETSDTEKKYIWTGSGGYTVGGNTYVGYGGILNIEPPPQTGELRINRTSMTLSNIRESIRELNALDLKGRKAVVYYGLFFDGKLVDNLIPILTMVIESSTISKSKETDVFIVQGITGANNLRYQTGITLSSQHHREFIKEEQDAGRVPTHILFPGSTTIPITLEDIGFDIIEENTIPKTGWGFSNQAQTPINRLPIVEESYLTTRRIGNVSV